MPSDIFWVFIKKSVYQLKNKDVQNVIIKTSATKDFQVCISIVYDSFFWNLALALVLVLHCYCGDSVK